MDFEKFLELIARGQRLAEKPIEGKPLQIDLMDEVNSAIEEFIRELTKYELEKAAREREEMQCVQ